MRDKHSPDQLQGPASPQISRFASHFRSNIVFGFLAQLTRMGVNFFLIAYVVRVLGTEQWGLISLATSTVTILALVQLGSSAGLAKKLNYCLARKDKQGFTQYFSAGMAFASIAATLILAALACIAAMPATLLAIPEHQIVQSRIVFIAIGATAILTTLSLPVIAGLHAAHRVDVQSRYDILNLLLRLILVVSAFAVFSASASLYASILAVCMLYVAIGRYIWLKRHLPAAVFKISALRRDVVYDALAFNVLTFLNGLIYMVFMQVPLILLQWTNGLILAGLYGISLQITTISRGFAMIVLTAINPIANSIVGSEQYDRAKMLFRISVRFFAISALTLWIAVYFLGPPLLGIWLSEDTEGLHDLVVALPHLFAVSAIGIAGMPGTTFTVAFERLRTVSVIGFGLGFGMNVILGIACLREEEGVLMVAASVQAVFFGLFQMYRLCFARGILEVPWDQFLVDLLVRPALPAVVQIAAFLVMSRVINVTTIYGVVATGAVTTSAALIVGYAVLFSGSERTLAINVFNARNESRRTTA